MTLQNKNEATVSSLTVKSILSQVLASIAQNLMFLNLGLANAFPSIVIPTLLGVDGSLSLTREQASWFGSLALIMHPIGSVMSGFAMEPLGRKKSLIIVNFPHMLAWVIIHFAQNISLLFAGCIILGLAKGFMEAPVMTYVGELSHPNIRGFMTGNSQIFIGAGSICSYLLAHFFTWRNIALISLTIHIITVITIIILVPETPIWLISKGRITDAVKSLCWVRGWAEPSAVQQEFYEILKYQKNSTECQQCLPNISNRTECPHYKKGVIEFIKEIYKNLSRTEMRRPLFLVFFIFLVKQLTGVTAIKPNLINIYRSFGLPINPLIALNITSGLGLTASIFFICVIKYLGKRPLLLASLIVLSVCNFLLGTYAFYKMPPGFTTYSNQDVIHDSKFVWIPTFLFFFSEMNYYAGACPIPWMMLSEIFPYRGRGHAVGLAAASSYIFGSIVTKTHLNMELSMGVHGTFWFYGTTTIFGVIWLYFYLPETEGKKIEQIEKEFSNEQMIIADNVITKKLMKMFSSRKNDSDETTHLLNK